MPNAGETFLVGWLPRTSTDLEQNYDTPQN